MVALIFAWIYFALRRTIRFREMADCIPKGFITMVPSILILVLATQLPYALTVAGISFLTYIIAGFVQNVWVPLLCGIVLTVAVLWRIRFFYTSTRKL